MVSHVIISEALGRELDPEESELLAVISSRCIAKINTDIGRGAPAVLSPMHSLLVYFFLHLPTPFIRIGFTYSPFHLKRERWEMRSKEEPFHLTAFFWWWGSLSDYLL